MDLLWGNARYLTARRFGPRGHAGNNFDAFAGQPLAASLYAVINSRLVYNPVECLPRTSTSALKSP